MTTPPTAVPFLPPPPGLACPRCRLQLRAYRTRRVRAGQVTRYRKCPACHYRCSTREVIVPRGRVW